VDSHSRVTELLGAIVSWCGATVAVLSILEWGLSERQKAKVKDWLETTWLFLSYRKPEDMEALIITPVGQLIVGAFSVFFAAAFLGLVIICGIFNLGDPMDPPSIGSAYWFGTTMGIGFALIYMRWLSASRNFKQYKSRSDHIAFLAKLSLIGLLFFGKMGQSVLDGLFAKCLALFFASLFFSLAAAGVEGLLFYWRPITWLMRCLLYVLQFVIQRVVESPKGPVLGLSGLLMAIGALVKIFGS
jgi:hypothetical protein